MPALKEGTMQASKIIDLPCATFFMWMNNLPYVQNLIYLISIISQRVYHAVNPGPSVSPSLYESFVG